MNSYCEININGLKTGLKYSIPAMRMLHEESSGKPDFMDATTYNFVIMAEILFAGYRNNCIVKRTVPTLLFEDFFEYVEDSLYDEDIAGEIKKAIETFDNCKFIKKAKEDRVLTESEKKSPLISTTLNEQPMENLDSVQQNSMS